MDDLVQYTHLLQTTLEQDAVTLAGVPWGRNGSWGAASEGAEEPPIDVELFLGYPQPLLTLATACCILFVLVGIPGNLITIVALFRCKKVRNATAVFIMNLSVSDLMFCCFNLPLAASLFWHRRWRHGHTLCRLFPLARYGLLAVSLFTILAITINRYVMIGHPRLYPKLYRRQWLGLMVACTWASGFGALVPTWLGVWGRFGLDTHIGSCSILQDEQHHSPKVFLFIVAFVIPCLAIVVCYARIFCIVRRTALKSRSAAPTEKMALKTTMSTSAFEEGTALSAKGPKRSNFSTATEDSAVGSSTTTTGASDKPPSVVENGHNNNLLLPPVQGEPSSSSGMGADDDSRCPTPSSLCSSAAATPDPQRKRRQHRDPATRINSAFNQMASVLRHGSHAKGSPRRPSAGNVAGVPVPGKMTAKDKRLLKMILVIFASFLVCYLPITISKTFPEAGDEPALNIAGYILIYLSTCINPIIYVVMSSEYRQAYKNLLMCRGYGPEPPQPAAARLMVQRA